MAKEPGSFYVDGTDFRYVDQAGNEYRFTGDLVTPSPVLPAEPGSVWIEGDYCYYIDASGNRRRLQGPSGGAQTGEKGSLWVESQWWAWIDENFIKRTGHIDIPFANSGGGTSHLDVAHGDVPAGTHGDVAQFSNHGDVPFVNVASHGDHRDVAFANHIDNFTDAFHSDTPDTHTDFTQTFVDFFDGDFGTHFDRPFIHLDSGIPHGDFTDTRFFEHADSPHGDQQHLDSTTNIAHGDRAHVNTSAFTPHTDVPAGAFVNVAHSDHTDTAVHSDIAHDDRPVFVGP